MTLDKPSINPMMATTEQMSLQDPTLAALVTIQQQLEAQATLLRTMNQELASLRESQTVYHTTLTKLDRQLRWTRWVRRIRGIIFLVFWLSAAAIVAYYWADLSQIWNDLARFIL